MTTAAPPDPRGRLSAVVGGVTNSPTQSRSRSYSTSTSTSSTMSSRITDRLVAGLADPGPNTPTVRVLPMARVHERARSGRRARWVALDLIRRGRYG